MKWSSFLRFLGISSGVGETYPDANYVGTLDKKEVTIYNTSQPTYRLIYDHHVQGIRFLNLQAIKKNKQHINAIMVLSKTGGGGDTYKILIKPGDRRASLKNKTQKLLCVVRNDYKVTACKADSSPSAYTMEWQIKPFVNGYKLQDKDSQYCLVRTTDNGILTMESCSKSTPEHRFDMLEVADDPYKHLYLSGSQLLAYEMQGSGGGGGSLPEWMMNGLAGTGNSHGPPPDEQGHTWPHQNDGYGKNGNPNDPSSMNSHWGHNNRQPWNGSNTPTNGLYGPGNQYWPNKPGANGYNPYCPPTANNNGNGPGFNNGNNGWGGNNGNHNNGYGPGSNNGNNNGPWGGNNGNGNGYGPGFNNNNGWAGNGNHNHGGNGWGGNNGSNNNGYGPGFNNGNNNGPWSGNNGNNGGWGGNNGNSGGWGGSNGNNGGWGGNNGNNGYGPGASNGNNGPWRGNQFHNNMIAAMNRGKGVIDLHDLGNNIGKLKDIVKTLKSFCNESFSEFGICAPSNNISSMSPNELQKLIKQHMEQAYQKPPSEYSPNNTHAHRNNAPHDEYSRYHQQDGINSHHQRHPMHPHRYRHPRHDENIEEHGPRHRRHAVYRHTSPRPKRPYISDDNQDSDYENCDYVDKTMNKHRKPRIKHDKYGRKLKCYPLHDLDEARLSSHRNRRRITHDDPYYREHDTTEYDEESPYRKKHFDDRQKRHQSYDY
ncbi:hypothetical protein NEPAR06_0702 [Nematocida parisii]|uniref:Uncharacterized protein n=1 Tax=Nematocida parisii (strain ERTm3) TaxID=935791 RepID=I3EHU9_NEMP3|nr:uncharacterized protein NEPG_02395 [Nematocida parisii ERTm1]EIJ88796.1 hypothetical protein NEQG_00615 [Nematocida parisii ERTm3]KAI5143027.1 hypothetical protein NEPAR07_0443 [Nematocida parisii]EIJ92704.1 hypothetical protein NEPG_02395 [Nematocida parisii ERTm1]KAI5153744.1 hypothetical protein NEPAR06_0702 [Nematocida parisii]KAI5156143.1 hypothetical protein NEPAR05_0320 [Nematocida parisii]|eukprot:XP_013060222.1 hypothetical protein NEPG_02395 [Nematocida parisii ERTm1]